MSTIKYYYYYYILLLFLNYIYTTFGDNNCTTSFNLQRQPIKTATGDFFGVVVYNITVIDCYPSSTCQTNVIYKNHTICARGGHPCFHTKLQDKVVNCSRSVTNGK